MESNKVIQVIIADDHHLVRAGICALLKEANDIEVVAEAGDGYQALELITMLQPDVVLVDIGMPKLDGIQMIQQLVKQKLNTVPIILSMHNQVPIVRRVLQLPIKGYVLKSALSDELLFAIRAAARGDMYLSAGISQILLNQLHDIQDGKMSSADTLTAREQEVLQCVATGNTNYQISQQLNISPKTVEKHRAQIMQKLGVADTPSLIKTAIEMGLIITETVLVV